MSSGDASAPVSALYACFRWSAQWMLMMTLGTIVSSSSGIVNVVVNMMLAPLEPYHVTGIWKAPAAYALKIVQLKKMKKRVYRNRQQAYPKTQPRLNE